MATSGLTQAVGEGALTLAESLLALGWTPQNVEAHILSRYGYLLGPEAEQIVTWAGAALAAGERLQESYGEFPVDDSGAPCLPGIGGSDWTIGYKFTWIDPDTGANRSWYDTMEVAPGTTVQEIFDASEDLFASTVGEEYLGGDVMEVSGYTFEIESVTCPA